MLKRIYITLVFLVTTVSSSFANKGIDPNVFDKVNPDSLIEVLKVSSDKADFWRADSLIITQAGEFNSEPNKTIILISVDRTKQLGFEYLYARSIFRESIMNTVRGNNAYAIRLAKEALLIFSKLNAPDVSGCYNTIGSMVATQGDTESGIEYLSKAIEINEKFKDKEEYATIFCDHHIVMGYIYLLAGEYDISEYYINIAYKKAKEINYWISQTCCILNLAKIHLKREEYEPALEDLYESLRIAREKNIRSIEALTEGRIAEVFLEMNELDNALVHYLIAEKIALNEGLEGRLLTIYDQEKELYLRKNNLQKAFDYQEKYIDLKNKISQREKEEEYQMLQVRFKVNEKNAQINNLALERNYELEKNQLLQIAVIVAAAAFILLVIIIILIFNRFRLNRKIQTERQEKEMSLYQMTALKSQMNPHFIFNALNSIQDLILKEQTEQSYTYITKFADLVRKTLNHSSAEFIDIEEELASIKLYLELEKLRFQDDLKIKFETNQISNVSIPPLLIQPFIENAIKHGLLHKEGEKHLSIRFVLKNSLICTITDNGVGRKASQEIQKRRTKAHPSFATKSIADRFLLLRKLYGEGLGVRYADLEENGKPSGTTVIIRMPYKQQF